MPLVRSGGCYLLNAALIVGLVGPAGGAGGHSFAPADGLDGYTTGLGIMDVSSDEFYHDADYRPIEQHGMPIEMRKMIASAESFHRNTLMDPEAQEREDARRRAKEHALPAQRIPRKIWQVCMEKPVPKVLQAYSATWSQENEEYLHTLCSEEEASSLVKDYYPELFDVYEKLAVQSRLDLFMYLILFKFGGVFATIDATCELPLNKLIRPQVMPPPC